MYLVKREIFFYIVLMEFIGIYFDIDQFLNYFILKKFEMDYVLL